MTLVTKFTSAELAKVVELGTLHGANVGSRELAKIGIVISPGAVYYWVKKAGNTGPRTRGPYAPRKPKAKSVEVVAIEV
jgi:hypothetical protein